jgi:hypothetical protein
VRLANSTTITVGREAFSTANELDQDIVELHDDYTVLKGRHTITVGTHNEFFKFRNLFLRNAFGTYTFNDLDLFEQGLAQQYDYSYATNPDKPAAKFGVPVAAERHVDHGHACRSPDVPGQADRQSGGLFKLWICHRHHTRGSPLFPAHRL